MTSTTTYVYKKKIQTSTSIAGAYFRDRFHFVSFIDLCTPYSHRKEEEMSFSQRVESSGEKDVKRIAVVGRGMIGSSILSIVENCCCGGYNVVEIYCIGPDEHPIDDKVDVYAAWYDEGRITAAQILINLGH